MATLTQTGNVKVVNVGLTPNDGTGDDLRTAFVKNNETITTISNFLQVSPTFGSASVTGAFATDSLTANTATFSNVVAFHGNITAASNVGVTGNITVGGHINGAVVSSNVFTTLLTVGSDTVDGMTTLYGPVYTGNVFVGTTLSPKNLTVTKDVEIHGELVVHGNVTTVTTSEFKVEYPVIEVGKGANVTLSSNDGKDRGIEFYWYDTVANTQQEGFFGFDNLSQKFTYIPRSNYGGSSDTDIYFGELGTALFGVVEANVLSSGNSVFNTIAANTITVTNGINGDLITAVQPNVTTLGTMTGLNVANGNVAVANGSLYVTGGAIYVNGVSVALSTSSFQGGTVPLNTIFASGFSSTSTSTGALTVVGGVGISGNLNVGGALSAPSFSATALGGTLTTAAQPNVTSVGTLGNLVVSNSLSSNYIGADHIVASNYINASTITASVGLGGTLTTVAQPNITSIGTLSSLAVTGAVAAGSFSGPLTGNVTGNVSGSAATVTTAAQPAITSVGNLTSLTVSGALGASSIDAGAGVIQTTGNIQTSSSVVGSTLYGTLRTASQPYITQVGALSSLTVNGASTLIGTTTFGSGIAAAGASSQDIGTTSNRFGTLYSAATNVAGTSTASIFSGTLSGPVGTGAATPAQGLFTTVTANGLIYSTTGGIKFPDGTVQLTAAAGGTVAYATSAGSVTGQTNSATITASTTANSQIVLRDSSGNFSAGTITATLNGPIVGSGAALTTGSVPVSALANSTVTLGSTGLTLGGAAVTTVSGLTSVTSTNFYGTFNGTATTAGSASTAGSITSQANSATTTASSANTANQIVLRDGSGSFSAGTITATFSGALTGSLSGTATNANTVGGYTPSTSAGVATRVVVADAGGYINNTYFNSTDNSVTTGVSAVMVKSGDNYLRSGTAAAVSAFLGLTNTSSLTASTGNAANTLVLRDSLGNFTAGTITALQYSGAGSGLTGTAGSLTAGAISSQANSATITSTSANTANTIVLRDASGNFSAGVITGTSTSARYADLAEKYQSDGEYSPGTVVVFGGSKEITVTGHRADVSVAGVVSTAPAYLMNIDEPNSVAVALRGKVPCKVIGPVNKGDLLVTSYVAGFAESVGKDGSFGVAVFAKSLDDDSGVGPKIINVVVI